MWFVTVVILYRFVHSCLARTHLVLTHSVCTTSRDKSVVAHHVFSLCYIAMLDDMCRYIHSAWTGLNITTYWRRTWVESNRSSVLCVQCNVKKLCRKYEFVVAHLANCAPARIQSWSKSYAKSAVSVLLFPSDLCFSMQFSQLSSPSLFDCCHSFLRFPDPERTESSSQDCLLWKFGLIHFTYVSAQ